MDIKKALSVLGYDELADEQTRRKVFRKLKFELQQRADKGDPNVDLAQINLAIRVFDRWIGGDEAASAAEKVATAQALQMLAADPNFTRADVQPTDPRPAGKQPPETGGGAGLLVGLGVAAFGAIMFALGASATSDGEDDDY